MMCLLTAVRNIVEVIICLAILARMGPALVAASRFSRDADEKQGGFPPCSIPLDQAFLGHADGVHAADDEVIEQPNLHEAQRVFDFLRDAPIRFGRLAETARMVVCQDDGPSVV